MKQKEIDALRELISQTSLATREQLYNIYNVKPTDLEDALSTIEARNRYRADYEKKRRNKQKLTAEGIVFSNKIC